VSDELVITPQRPEGRPARLADYLCAGSDRASWRLRSGERWCVTSRCRAVEGGLVREVAIASPDGTPIDRLEFTLTADRFVERAADGRLLADLPATLELHAPQPLSGGRVWLGFVGPAELRLGEARERIDVMALEADIEGERRVQWLARGIGELAIGPADGPFDRWLTGWQGGGRSLFGGVS